LKNYTFIPSALGILPSETVQGSEWYRVVQPLRALEKVGWRTAVVTEKDFHAAIAGGSQPWTNWQFILTQRVAGTEKIRSWNKAAIGLRALGHVVISDYDDDYTNQHRVVLSEPMESLRGFSGLITSTPYLTRVMKTYHQTVQTVPNRINFPQMAGFRRHFPKNWTVIGLTGSKTHIDDWKPAVKAVLQILSEHENVRVFCTGYIPQELLGHPKLLRLSDAGYQEEDNQKFLPITQYPFIHANIDILLCPVDPLDRFNWSKSGIKAIEGMASARKVAGQAGGSFVIASDDLPCYQGIVVDGKTGIVVDHHDVGAWVQSIAVAINEVEFRHRVQLSGHQHCLGQFDLLSNIRERVAAFEEIYKADQATFKKTFRNSVAALDLNQEN
jgi:glycosyltransferase involved in cell wall biosynthesis